MPYVPGQTLGGVRADIGPVPLGTVDSAGVAWFLQTLEGWDSPEVRAELQEREADHGSWETPAYYGSRPVTMTGTIVAPDLASLDAAMDRLLASVTLTDATLVVYQSIPRQARVRRSGKPLLAYITDTKATYSVLVTAADPRRYGTTLHTVGPVHLPSVTGGLAFPLGMPITFAATVNGGQVVARNIGNFPSRPLLTISGPVVQPQVIATWPDGSLHTLTYTGTLAAGDVLTLDVDAHDAYLAGGVSRRRFVSGEWPELPPGDTVLAFRSPGYSSTATLAATWRPAWI